MLASHRDPESYIAGATPLNLRTIRFSSDIDIFNDREEHVAIAAATDAQSLQHAGYTVRWLRQLPAIQAAEVARAGLSTRLEWVADSDFRFFPTMPDETFGYVLHPVDLAINKLMAAAGRRAVRDLVDLITVNDNILSLGAVAWAAVEKSPGFTPEGLIAEVRRNSHYPAGEWMEIESTVPIDPVAVTQRLRLVLNEAEHFVSQMPSDKAGLLFLKNGSVIEPDPDRLDAYQTHTGQRRGHWPSSPEIATAMLERQANKPSST
jgi:hypothetical protein